MRTLILFFALAMLVFTGCKKDELATTDLQLTVKDQLGNPVNGATVSLYTSLSDWQNNQYVFSSVSDASGKVKFTGLNSQIYYWYAQSDCLNNYNGGMSSTSQILENQTTSFDVILSSTGTIKIVNTFLNPYKIYLNGTYSGDINGRYSTLFSNLPTGTYTIRYVQISGYALYPTDVTLTGTVTCGGLLTATMQ